MTDLKLICYMFYSRFAARMLRIRYWERTGVWLDDYHADKLHYHYDLVQRGRYLYMRG